MRYKLCTTDYRTATILPKRIPWYFHGSTEILAVNFSSYFVNFGSLSHRERKILHRILKISGMAFACGVSNNLFLIGSYRHQYEDCLLYSKILPTFKSRTLRNRSNYPVICRSRFQFVHKSAPDNNSSNFSKSPPQESQGSDSDTLIKFRESNDGQKSLFHDPFSRFR